MPFGVALISEIPRRLRTMNRNPKNESKGGSIRGWILAALFVAGILMVFASVEWRTGLILFVLPAIAAVALAKYGGQEKEFLSDVVLVFLILVAFNYTTRSLAQLLIDPHNYRPAE
jgi:energy-coupling factor transporter transmembrane protein EcfT